MQNSSARANRVAVISGASGLVGTALSKLLSASGWRVLSLVRREAKTDDEFQWDPATGQIPIDKLLDIPKIDVFINLSGASISRIPWTKKYRQELRESRIQATTTLVDAISKLSESGKAPESFISGSAYGFYGDRPGEKLTESSPAGRGFLAELVTAWEASANQAAGFTRTVNIRTSLVLAETGFLSIIWSNAKLFLGSKYGSGKQHWPWIHLDDEVRAIQFLIDSKIDGPVNLAAPELTTADEFVKTVSKIAKRPAWLRIPKFMVRLMGEAGESLILADAAVLPSKLEEAGFQWQHPRLLEAVESLV